MNITFDIYIVYLSIYWGGRSIDTRPMGVVPLSHTSYIDLSVCGPITLIDQMNITQ